MLMKNVSLLIVSLVLLILPGFAQQFLDEMELVDISREHDVKSTIIRDPNQALLIVKTQIPDIRFQSNNIIKNVKEALEVEDYDAAIRYFKAYLKDSPNDADGHLQLGCALLKKGSLKEAVNAFKESIDLNPHNEKTRVLIKESLFNEADVFFSEGKNDIGMRYLTAHVTINPDDVDTHIILAKEFIKMGSTRNAMVCVNKAVELDPKNPEVVKLLDYFSDGFH